MTNSKLVIPEKFTTILLQRGSKKYQAPLWTQLNYYLNQYAIENNKLWSVRYDERRIGSPRLLCLVVLQERLNNPVDQYIWGDIGIQQRLSFVRPVSSVVLHTYGLVHTDDSFITNIRSAENNTLALLTQFAADPSQKVPYKLSEGL